MTSVKFDNKNIFAWAELCKQKILKQFIDNFALNQSRCFGMVQDI